MHILNRTFPDPRLWLRPVYPSWPQGDEQALDGYSILLPVPSDLPVFYRMAVQVIAHQSLKRANEVIVIPDLNSSAFEAVVSRDGPMIGSARLVYCGNSRAADAVSKLYRRPNFLHAAQIIRGLSQARSKYALLHDADLFLFDNAFIDRLHEIISTRDLNALGVSTVWDPWYAQNCMPHVAATWEMMLSTRWAKSFDPILLTPHSNHVGSLYHKFDTLLYVQCLTAPESIEKVSMTDGFVHFSYVICTYRNFIQSKGPFIDNRFIIMLLRILIDEFDPGGHYPRVPSWAELVGAIGSTNSRIGFPDAPSGRDAYFEVRSKLDRFLDLPMVSSDGKAGITRRLARFDEIYQWDHHLAGNLSLAMSKMD
jgi:hypothetical protein